MNNRRFVDLHTHSLASDGADSPSVIVRMADELKLAAVAVTDHDTTAGIAEARQAAGSFAELCFVAGIEVSATFMGGTLHILGLAIDEHSPKLASMVASLRQARDERNPNMIRKLQELGLDIAMEDVLAVACESAVARAPSPVDHPGAPPGQLAGSVTPEDTSGTTEAQPKRVVSRLHIAEALRRKHFVSSTGDAFDRYIGEGRPAYIDKERLPPREVIAAIREAGGLAAVAHPVQLGCTNRLQFETILRGLIRDGLEGIEVYHSDHNPEQTRLYLDMARKFDLAATGGSDYHGRNKPVQLGRPVVPLGANSDKWQRRLFGKCL